MNALTLTVSLFRNIHIIFANEESSESADEQKENIWYGSIC